MRRSLAVLACLLIAACDTTGPTESTQTPAPQPVVASTPVPAAVPSPTPTPASGGNAETKVFEIWGEPGTTIVVSYNGEASYAQYVTYSRDFDATKPNDDARTDTIKSGDTQRRSFPQVCVEVDVEQVGVKPIGGIWFDINGNPFTNPERNTDKIAACRNRCVPQWFELETRKIGEWEVDPNPVVPSTLTQKCYKYERRLVIVFEQNSCTKETRELRRFYETRTVEVPCECVETGPKDVPGQPTWFPTIYEGKCTQEVGALDLGAFTELTTPSLNCHQNGQQQIKEDYTCKADTERTRALCRNVACPTPEPTCENTPAFFKGNHNFGLFNLDNSSAASELAKVNSIVGLGPWEKFDDEGDKDDNCTGADVSAKVVIVKAGSSQSVTWSYRTYLNVTQGQQICSWNGQGGNKDISHVTYFRCDQ